MSATGKRALGWALAAGFLIQLFGDSVGLHKVGMLMFAIEVIVGAYLTGRAAVTLIIEGRFPWE